MGAVHTAFSDPATRPSRPMKAHPFLSRYRLHCAIAILVLLGSNPAWAQMQAAHSFAGGSQACEECHGPRGDGRNESTPRLNGQQADYIFLRVQQLLTFPSRSSSSDISQFSGRADVGALTAIANYFASQPPSPSKPGPLASAGKRLYEYGDHAHFVQECQRCHGAEGEGHGAIPRLAGQHANYLERQLRLFSSGQREARSMHFPTLELTDDEINALTSYLAGD